MAKTATKKTVRRRREKKHIEKAAVHLADKLSRSKFVKETIAAKVN